MRSVSFLGLALAAMFMASNTLAAVDHFTGLRFADGKSHSSDDYSKQSLFLVYYCGH